MGLIYGVTWYAMSLAMPGIFSLNSVLKDQMEPTDRTMENLRFWLKYWVVFAYYFIMEFVLDCFISWVPFYSEVNILFCGNFFIPTKPKKMKIYQSQQISMPKLLFFFQTTSFITFYSVGI